MTVESIHLASTHRAFDTRIFQKECRTLARAGHRVTFIVPHERDEVVEGVRIKAVPPPADGKERLTKTLGLIYRAALEASPEAVFHFHDSELIFHMLALKARGRRVVYDAHEDTPKQVMYQHWIPRALRRPIAWVMRAAERLGSRVFDGVIAAEPGIYARFPDEHRALVHNFPLLDELCPARPTPYALRPPHVAYVGSITEVRGVREMMEAVDRLPPDLHARLILGGPFHPPALEQRVQAWRGRASTDVEGWLSRPQVADVLGRSRAGIVTIYPTPKYLASYPTKLFEYMSAGLPVIASDFPGWRPFIEEAECGFLVDPRDPSAIAGAMQWILEHPVEAEAMGRRGREAVEKHYNWEREAATMLAFYDRLARAGTA